MNDFDDLPAVPDGGGLAPYSPSQPLAPSPDYGWMTPQADYLSERQLAPQLFGQPLPPGMTQQHVEQTLEGLARGFMADMARLGMSPNLTSAAIDWYRQAATQSVPREPPNHSYRLSDLTISREDIPWVIAFANHMHRIGADETFVRNAVWWVDEISKQLDQSKTGDVTDAEWQQIENNNEAYIQAGADELRVRWGHEYSARLRVVKKYYYGLSVVEREFFENALLPGGQLALNNADVIERLYMQAIGGNNLPSGPALQLEIASIERLMKTDRCAYLKDETLQARLRQLYQLRDGD